MKLEFTNIFKKALKRLPPNRRKRIQQSLKRFIEAPERAGGRLHKLQNLEDLWSLSANKDRIIMQKLEGNDDTWLIHDVGAHDEVYRRANRK